MAALRCPNIRTPLGVAGVIQRSAGHYVWHQLGCSYLSHSRGYGLWTPGRIHTPVGLRTAHLGARSPPNLRQLTLGPCGAQWTGVATWRHYTGLAEGEAIYWQKKLTHFALFCIAETAVLASSEGGKREVTSTPSLHQHTRRVQQPETHCCVKINIMSM